MKRTHSHSNRGFAFAEGGFTLVELLISAGISVLLALVVSTLVTQALSSPKVFNNKLALQELQRNTFFVILNEQAMEHTIENNPSMACLTDEIPCDNTTVHAINLYQANGSEFSMSGTDTSIGFTEGGAPCSNFDHVNGNAACPLRIEISWRPICPVLATSCIPDQYQITGKIIFKSNGPSTLTSMKMPSFSFVRNLQRNKTPIAITAGDNHTCVLLQEGNVMCWGKNTEGQIGGGPSVGAYAEKPTYVVDSSGQRLADIDQIDSGKRHTCARKTNGHMFCWGYNYQGNLGQGSFLLGAADQSDVALEVKVPDPSDTTQLIPLVDVRQIQANHENSCAIKTDGDVLCWGWGEQGRMPFVKAAFLSGSFPASYFRYGNTVNATSNVPISVFTDPTKIPPEILTAKSSAPSTVEFFLGSRTGCLLYPTDRSLMCWGSNQYSELMDLNTFQTALPHDVTMADNIVDMSATFKFWNVGGDPGASLTNIVTTQMGLRSTCSIIKVGSDQQLACWGYNERGQIGNGNVRPMPPVLLGGDPHPTEPNWWGWHGSVESWDPVANSLYPSGVASGSTGEPRPVWVVAEGGAAGTKLTQVKSFAMGNEHGCAIRTDGKLLCWGWNGYGQLGIGNLTSVSSPTAVVGLSASTPVAIAAGDAHTCAIFSNKKVHCWGRNNLSQLGQGVGLNGGVATTRRDVWGF